MSTRCHIAVYENKDTELTDWTALLYRHSDGYPGKADGSKYGVLFDIVPFVKKFISNRGWDNEYLAARLMQYLTNLYDEEMGDEGSGLFEFVGYGISNTIHVDVEYFYALYPDRIEVYNLLHDCEPTIFTLKETITI